jgi:hypothetical protein
VDLLPAARDEPAAVDILPSPARTPLPPADVLRSLGSKSDGMFSAMSRAELEGMVAGIQQYARARLLDAA